MVRNTQSNVNLNLPRRYARTFVVTPDEKRARFTAPGLLPAVAAASQEAAQRNRRDEEPGEDVVAYLDQEGVGCRPQPAPRRPSFRRSIACRSTRS